VFFSSSTVPAWIAFPGVATFLVLLLGACITDIRSRRIPNKLVLVLMACGLAFSLVVSPTLSTPVRWAGSLLLGLAIWLPFYLSRMLGAGDVKLFAAASTWLGSAAVVEAALWSALIGGLLAVVWFVWSHGFGFAVMRLSHASQQLRILREPLPVAMNRRPLPYGVAMSLGLLVTVLRLLNMPSFS
jgi:prepilin peptidase CpaA